MYFKKECVFCGKKHLHKKNADGSIVAHDNEDKKLPNII